MRRLRWRERKDVGTLVERSQNFVLPASSLRHQGLGFQGLQCLQLHFQIVPDGGKWSPPSSSSVLLLTLLISSSSSVPNSPCHLFHLEIRFMGGARCSRSVGHYSHCMLYGVCDMGPCSSSWALGDQSCRGPHTGSIGSQWTDAADQGHRAPSGQRLLTRDTVGNGWRRLTRVIYH